MKEILSKKLQRIFVHDHDTDQSNDIPDIYDPKNEKKILIDFLDDQFF